MFCKTSSCSRLFRHPSALLQGPLIGLFADVCAELDSSGNHGTVAADLV